MDVQKKLFSLFLSIAMIFSIFTLDTVGAHAMIVPVKLYVDSGNITITDSGFFIDSGNINYWGGVYLITQHDSGAATPHTVTVGSGTHNITIQNVNVDVSGKNGICAFSIEQGAAVSLALEGDNILKSGQKRAGLEVPGNPGSLANNALLTVTSNSNGSLKATGGNRGAGIGGGDGNTSGHIIINSGTVTAIGNIGGAGIGGGGDGGAGGSTIISGGTVTANGGQYGAGIGGGASSTNDNSSITISNGTVTATGGTGGAGIGGGDRGPAGTVTVSAGTVKANGGQYGSGIGGGNNGDGGKITISGGTVTATGGQYCAGIGGGWNNTGGSLTINSAMVTAIGGQYGAGIGGGNCGAGGTVSITGSNTTVYAQGNNGSKDIGSGYESSNDGSLTIGDASVTTGPVVELKAAGTSASNPNSNKPQFMNCILKGGGAGNRRGVYDALGKIKLSLSIGASPDPAAFGDKVTLKATLHKEQFPDDFIVTTGLVSFGYLQENGLTVPIGNTVQVNGGDIAELNWTPFIGIYNITAAFLPNDSSGPYSQTAFIDQLPNYTVNQAIPSVSLKAGSVPQVGGNTVLTATVTGVSGHVPSGTVTFKDGGNRLGTEVLLNGDATFHWNSVPFGSHNLTASYSGDTDYKNTDSAELDYNIGKKTQAPLTISGVPASVVYGGKGFVLKISGGNGGGKLTYAVNGSSVSVDSFGNVSITGAGDSSVTVTKEGDSDYNPVQAAAVIRVQRGAPSVKAALNAAVASGSALSSAVISGEMVNTSGMSVSGSFTWGNPSAVVTESGNYPAIFVPADTADYNSAPVLINISVFDEHQHSSEPKPKLPTTVTDTPTGAGVDLTGSTMPSGVTGVSLSASQITQSQTSDPQAANVFHVISSDMNKNMIGMPVIYNLKLLDQNGNVITGFSGKVTVRISLPEGLRGTPRVFRDEESTGTFIDMNAVVENGYLVFKTDHLSYYAVAGTGDSITLDTRSYNMPLNGHYEIGLKITGTKAAYVKVYSTNDKITAVAKLKNGNYQVTGVKSGTAYIMFDVYDSKNKFLTHASVRIDVKTGIRPRGDSTRQLGLFK